MSSLSSRLSPRAGRLARPLAALLAVALLAGGCDFNINPAPVDNKPTPTPARPTPTRPPSKPGETLTIRLQADVPMLNPWLAGGTAESQQVTGLIFGGLTRIDNHLQPQPGLADSWEVSGDGTQLIFHLRQNVKWHDGEPFTAQDVVWSYNTLARLPASNSTLLHIQDAVSSVEAVDPVSYTVRFNFKRRYSPVLSDLAMPILPSHILSGTTPDSLAASPFNDKPVGTGPFMYDSRQPGKSITFRANPSYYAGRPAIDRVGFIVAPDDAVAESAVKDGTLLLAQLPPAAAERLVTGGGGIRGGAYDELGYDFVAFNLRPPHPFSDTRLRKAWAEAIDKPGMVYAATGGGGDPVWSDVASSSWAYNPDVPKPGGHADEARKLLSDAGWVDTNKDGIVDKGGKPLQINLYVRSDSPMRRQAAENMAEQLLKVGIKVNVQAADFESALRARISPDTNPPFDFDAVVLGWTRTGYDPDPFALFHSSQIPNPAAPGLLNFTGFSAAEFDNLAIQGRSTYDYGQRKQIYARTQEIIADQLPYYFLWAQKFGVVAGPKLQGDIDFSSPAYLWNIDQWWIK